MMYSREYEAMKRDDLEQLQLERLQTTLNRVYRNVAAYRRALDAEGIEVERLRGLSDLRYLPFTTKEDLRRSYPYDAFAMPLRDIVRIHSTSGTTGKPIVVGYTKADLNTWSSLVARVLTAVGIHDQDFVQIAFAYTINTAGLGFHNGAERIGASVIPSSNEDIRRQIGIMKDYKTSALVSTPGYALHIASVLEELEMHPEDLFLRVGLFGAEPWSETLRRQIERSLHLSAYDNYGLTEVMGPGVAYECEERDGLHINEDHFIAEVVDPETGEPLPPGTEGELVFTTITKQGFPLVRYRTGDVSAITYESCRCGRTSARMQRVRGRTDDMIIVEGTNVYPSRIEEVLLDVEGVEPHYQIILDREQGMDTMEVQVEVVPNLPGIDITRSILDFRRRIESELRTALGISPKITLVEPKTLERSTGGKMHRVLDRREA